MDITSLQDLVRQKVEHLRPKLLDLSRRNPLLATKLTPRSNAHIRVVDELPDVLFYKLNNEQEMRLVPLPDIDEDPRDEDTKGFRDALANARLTDDEYLRGLESIQRDADDYLDRTRAIERALKDRVRSELNMAKRPHRAEVNLAQHARNNGITPSYDLPEPDNDSREDRHGDDDIQTLQLPKDLERKLNTITSKCRTWIQETGINVLHIAYGFLEWSESAQAETAYAPLVLCGAQIEKKRTREGIEFYLKGNGDEPEVNAVLAEKMRIEFGIEMPAFDGTSIEGYLAAIASVAPRDLVWRVRRQVAIGVFPSARMAMYHDIDPKQPNFPESEIVRGLLTGSNSESAVPFAEEYNVDEPSIEQTVPCLVMDADSSQFSALVDIASGKNLAVEGPPGTGKSQTIVNAIAAALADGKKVLFVAEKLAALNVVRARLEAVGLGEFLLPLQAERSTREQVIGSVRSRVEMRAPEPVRTYDQQLEEFRLTRQHLSDYIDLLKFRFAASGMTVHEILSGSIATVDLLHNVPAEVIEQSQLSGIYLNKLGLKKLRALGDRVEDAHRDCALAKDCWKNTQLINPERFAVDEACRLAASASQAFRALAIARDQMAEHQLDRDTPIDQLILMLAAMQGMNMLPDKSSELLLPLLQEDAPDVVLDFIQDCEENRSSAHWLLTILAALPDDKTLADIERLDSTCANSGIDTLDLVALDHALAVTRGLLQKARGIEALMAPLVHIKPEAAQWNLRAIGYAAQAIATAGRDALLCRTITTNDPAALALLQTLIAEGYSLQAERTELSQQVSLSVEIHPHELNAAISTLRSSGPFSILSPSFRKAKRLARSLSLTDRFDKRDALSRLQKLANFRTREQSFLQNPQTAVLFGVHFRGIDTDFALFERLATYYAAVQNLAPGAVLRALRSFLREADWEELEAVPSIPIDTSIDTLQTLQSDVSEIQRRIDLLERAILDMGPLLRVFRQPSTVKPGILPVLIVAIRKYFEQRAAIDGNQRVRHILGARFAGAGTDLNPVKPACLWAKAAAPLASSLASVLRNVDPTKAAPCIEAVVHSQREADHRAARLTEIAQINFNELVGGKSEMAVSYALEEASRDNDGLFAHAALATTIADASHAGIDALIRFRIASGSTADLAAQVEALGIRSLARAVYAEHGRVLSKYSGRRLDELRAALARQDKEVISLAQRQLRWKVHATAKPPRGVGSGKKSSWTQMALIENEISKQQRFISVRDLTQRAGQALLELKPCWMMSPLAVAQYVPKERISFDLCIIDEASQMPPEAAIGALLRCKQTMVVGDTNQLPPSSFFRKIIDDEEADEDEAVLNESILEMANATFRPARRLRWHYRSRHSGLIKFSNRLVYNDDLIVFPSATEAMSQMGVEYRRVDGLYKAGTNAAEARAMVDAALEFMRTDPGRSLGIVTLNQKQRDLIAEEFEYALSRDRHAQNYVEAWKIQHDGLEEFFIKNLENVQGDERDVIFIGTVYGPEIRGGKVAQRFGPINGVAGKRRLNVLFSRAKEKIVTFSSLTSADIAAEESGNAGAYMLKRWLEYAAVGVLEGGINTRKEPDSDFEVFVMEQVRALGCEPVPQVGVAGYYVDIGVKHPDWPHGFILGIECDGASYHSAKSARDRDRLRQEVLEKLGWQIHRIWSTDWFNNPRAQVERMRITINDRMLALKAREAEFTLRPVVTPESSAPLVEPREHSAISNNQLHFFSAQTQSAEGYKHGKPANDRGIAVGDTVRVRYLTGDCKVLIFTISETKSDLSQGIIHHEAPIAKALLGAEQGDEVEVLNGPYVRPAVVEEIVKRTD